jgi:excisionase family DNA binding protein
MDSIEKLLCVKEAASALNASRDSIVRLILRGHLRGVKFPRMGGSGSNVSWRIPESEIRLFLKRNLT